MIGDLVAGLDVLQSSDLDDVLDEVDFRIRPARMIDVARSVAAGGAVDRPSRVDLEQVAGVEIVGTRGRNLATVVADDELPFLDGHGREQAEPGLRAADPQVAGRYQFRGHDIMVRPVRSARSFVR